MTHTVNHPRGFGLLLAVTLATGLFASPSHAQVAEEVHHHFSRRLEVAPVTDCPRFTSGSEAMGGTELLVETSLMPGSRIRHQVVYRGLERRARGNDGLPLTAQPVLRGEAVSRTPQPDGTVVIVAAGVVQTTFHSAGGRLMSRSVEGGAATLRASFEDPWNPMDDVLVSERFEPDLGREVVQGLCDVGAGLLP